MSLIKKPFAHRGLHNDSFPENSLPAFENAVQNRYGIELDVHLMKDGRLVVFHDDELERMTEKEGFVKELTRDMLSEYKLKDTTYCIPTLKAALDLVKGRVPLLIELKVERNVKKIAKAFVNECEKYNGEVFVQSFHPFVLRKLYKLAPRYKRGQLSSFFEQNEISYFKRFIIKRLWLLKYCHVNFVSYNHKNLPNKFCKKCKLPIFAYTVRTEEEQKRLSDCSDNFIFENYLP